MERNKKIVFVAIVALVVSIASISIAFAAISSVLTIEGTGSLNPSDWEVSFDVASLTMDKSTSSEATAASEMSINSTMIGPYSVTLREPGDYVKYEFDVVNSGALNAKIAAFSMPDPVCSGSSTEDEELVCNNLVYTLTYDTTSGANVIQGDTLATAASKTMVLYIEYPAGSAMPSEDVVINFGTVSMTYGQQ